MEEDKPRSVVQLLPQSSDGAESSNLSATDFGEVEADSSVPHADTVSPQTVSEFNTEQTECTLSLYELVRTDIIKCAHCEDVYTYPCILPCLHSFCGACIDKLHHKSAEQEECSSSDTVVGCPICQTVHLVPIGGFPCNHFLCNLVEIYDAQQDEEIPCTYCQYEFEESIACTRCVQCQDNLCQNCAAAHKKTKITRNHILAPFEQIRLGRYDHDIRQVQTVNCNNHPMQPCTLFCQECEHLFCSECTEHKNHPTMSLDNSSLTELDLVQKLTQTISDRLPSYISYQEFLRGYSERLTQKNDEVVKDLNRQAEMLHEMIEQQKAEMLAKIQTHVSETSDSIFKELTVVENMSNSYSSNLQFMDSLIHYSKPEEFIDLQTVISSRLEKVNCEITKHELNSELAISFCNGATNEGCELALRELFGELRIAAHPSTTHQQHGTESSSEEDHIYNNPRMTSLSMFTKPAYTPKLLPRPKLCLEFDSSLSTDSNNTWPTGVCCSVLGEIIVCDRDNGLIKIFSGSGIYKSSFNGELDYKLIKPFDIASLSTGEIVVTDYGSESVKVFSTSGIGRLKITGEFEYPRGITTTSEDLILVLDSELGRVTIHSSTDGRLLKTVKGFSPSTNMIDPYYICASRLGDIIVTDFAEPNIKILNMNGEQPPGLSYGEYGVTTRQGLLQPYGCCQDTYGITLIADNRNDKISVLMPNGKFDKHLLTRNEGLWQPIALCIDMYGQLIVTEGLGKVKIFKYI